MKYILICKNEYGLCTGVTYVDCSENEVELTEEQYNNIECPCIITLSNDGKLGTWVKSELPDNLFPVPVVEKTPMELLQERILQLEVAEVNRKSTEIEQQIMGGI